MHILMRNVDSPRSEQKWRLHPLMHTLPIFNAAQNIVVFQRFTGSFSGGGCCEQCVTRWVSC